MCQSQPSIDLNADVGEDPAALARDEAIAACVTTINIACGGHAGDESTMRHLLKVAKRLDLNVAAHPSYPDRANFGRVAMTIAPDALSQTIAEQVGTLARIAHDLGVRVRRVKPHGALYHAANHDPSVCDAIALGVDRIIPDAAFIAQACLGAAAHWRSQARTVLEEAFADRRYNADATLVGREHAGALIESAPLVAEQALRIATGQPITTFQGTPLTIRADTICIHGDTPNALENATAVAAALRAS